MRENSTHIGDRYECRKTIQFLKNNLSKDFKLFTIINKRIIDNLFNYPGGPSQVVVKPGCVGIMPGT